jgi:hypothetical protein
MTQQDWIISDPQDASAGENGSHGGAGPNFVAMKKEGSGDSDNKMCNVLEPLTAETMIIFATRNSAS